MKKLQILPFDPNKGVVVSVDGDKQQTVGNLNGYPIFRAPSLKDPKQEVLYTEYLAFLTQIGTHISDDGDNGSHTSLFIDVVTHIWGQSGIDELFEWMDG